MIRFYKFISFFFFPGAVAVFAYAFLLNLASEIPHYAFPYNGMHLAETAQNANSTLTANTTANHHILPFFQLNALLPLFCYILLPMAIVFYLKFTGKIQSIQLPKAEDRKIPLMASLFLAFFVVQFHIYALSNPEYLWLGKSLPHKLYAELAQTHIRKWLSTHIAWELTTFSILIFLTLFINFLITSFMNFKISIHQSAVTTTSIFLIASLQRIHKYAVQFPQNIDLQLPQYLNHPALLPVTILLALLLIVTMYISRLNLKAHTPKELNAAIILSCVINIPCALILSLLYPH